MTDWDQIAGYIHNAMQAVDQAHAASENLRNDTSPETLDAFKSQMEELCEHLRALKNVIEHTSTYSMDELVDVLSEMISGKPAAFRRTKHIEP
jgi:uncharacterized protein YukE